MFNYEEQRLKKIVENKTRLEILWLPNTNCFKIPPKNTKNKKGKRKER